MTIKIEKDILLIEHFLTAEECTNYINYSEYLGFQPADVDVHGTRKQIDQIRTNERADIESQQIADNLWETLKDNPLPENNQSKAVGLSPFIRFYRYTGTQKFNMHKDGRKHHQGFESQYTMLVYLNTVEQGGETVFRKNEIKIKPQAGYCLLFAHELWHSGIPVTGEDIKYVLRTDVLYSH
ncbi:2OG-Fe(II) oxygenase [uncultured Gimesia sp.]|uniref:2OG-Fe(II) oxygenase n=1 Tax=uncultured Gimesia sp. TaxID=1678688 RepID=UPI0030DA0175|tara:strand:- start:111151 stop:111696 length:546 start_codon:yes stop_codon:yes gene_type:complete